MKVSETAKSIAEAETRFANDELSADAALKVVERALRAVPWYPEALLFRAQLLAISGRSDERLAALRHVLDVDPWRYEAYFEQAEALFEQGDAAESISTLCQGIIGIASALASGIEGFLLELDEAERPAVERVILQAVDDFIRSFATSSDLEDLRILLRSLPPFSA